jgi:hypothetical protein
MSKAFEPIASTDLNTVSGGWGWVKHIPAAWEGAKMFGKVTSWIDRNSPKGPSLGDYSPGTPKHFLK